MTTIGKILLFFSSWFPAYAMMAFVAQDGHKEMALGFWALTATSILTYVLMENLVFRRAALSLRVKSISRRDENILMYVIAYLPPFFAINIGLYGQLLALAAFYVVFSITYVKLNLYYLNPMFVFRSYRSYTIVSDSGAEYIALIKYPFVPVPGETVQYRGRDNILLITGAGAA